MRFKISTVKSAKEKKGKNNNQTDGHSLKVVGEYSVVFFWGFGLRYNKPARVN